MNEKRIASTDLWPDSASYNRRFTNKRFAQANSATLPGLTAETPALRAIQARRPSRVSQDRRTPAAALYTTHRPQTFGAVVGQASITASLKRQAQARRIGHAYLFAGPSGVGKTTLARIVAMAANCECLDDGEPCGRCQSCRSIVQGSHWDVLEMDAADERGIDDIRAIKGRAHLMPLTAGRKVYILDECHRLTGWAWDALLKILEEPPPYLLWCLCTTDFDAVPETVASRCQVHKLEPVAEPAIMERLADVCMAESIPADSAALSFIAQSCGGNVRMALTMLESQAR